MLKEPSLHFSKLDEKIQKLAIFRGQGSKLRRIQLGEIERLDQRFGFWKYEFEPKGEVWMRVGIFAGIHGDEPAGSYAALELVERLAQGELGVDSVALKIYPICNPAGLWIGERNLPGGPDLNRIFWTGSEEPEVKMLEEELRREKFDGIIALHSDDTADGIYGYVGGDLLTRHLLEPALAAASAVIPRSKEPLIDGWRAKDAIIEERFQGILSAPPEQVPKPFEIVFETPSEFELGVQVLAQGIAVEAVLEAAIRLMSHAMNL